MAEGSVAWDPADEATPQPPQQAAAGSAPRGPPGQPRVPEGSGTSTPAAVATILRTLLGPAAGRLFLRSVERALDAAWHWLNQHLPLGGTQAVDGAAEGPNSAAEGPVLWRSPLLALGSVSGSAKSRAVALGQQLWQKWLATHRHLLLTVTEAVRRGLEELLRTSQGIQMRKNQVQANPCPHPACTGTQARPAEGCGTPALLPGQALARAGVLVQRLQDPLVQLWTRVGQLPVPLQQAARRAQRGAAELHGAFGRAGSPRELLGTAMARGCEAVARVWEVLRVFLLQHRPWLQDASGTVAPRTPPPHPQT